MQRFYRILIFFVAGVILRWLSLGFPGSEALQSYWIGSDASLVYGMTQMMREHFWWPFTALSSNRFSIPEGFYFPQFPMFDVVHWAILEALTYLTNSPITAYNIYIIGGAGMVSLAMSLLCASLGMSFGLSLAAGLAYSSLPMAYERFHHLFIGLYFQVPITFYILLRFKENINRLKLVTLSLLIGLSGLYFAFFAASAFAFVGTLEIFFSYWKKSGNLKIICRNLIITLTAILLPIILSMIPTWMAAPSDALTRNPNEALIWGMEIQNLILPPTHHLFPPFQEVRPLFFSWETLNRMSEFEGYNEYIGLISIIGILISLAFWFRKTKGEKASTYTLLGICAIWFIALGQKYGLGTFIAFHVSPQIRSYNRVSIFVATAGFIAFLIWLSPYIDRLKKPWQKYLAMVMLLVLALLDYGTFWRPVDPKYADTRSNREFAEKVYSAVKDKPILKLPFGVFPEWPGYPSVESYSGFQFLIFAPIRSTFASIKGTAETQNKVNLFFGRVPTPQSARDFGLAGVVIDTWDYQDHGVEATQTLKQNPDQIIFDSPNGRFRFIGL